MNKLLYLYEKAELNLARHCESPYRNTLEGIAIARREALRAMGIAEERLDAIAQRIATST